MNSLKVLILAGGHSSRMGAPKHLLSLPDGPLYVQLVKVLSEALPETETVYFSIANRSDLDETLRKGVLFLLSGNNPGPNSVKLQLVQDEAEQDIGPAAGLLAAHHHDPVATWLVIACDFPLLQAATVRQLIDSYEAPVTCFRNAEGYSEPLLGIWSPRALQNLHENVKCGRSGPSYTLKGLNGKLIQPIQDEWLTNVNTPQEWQAAKRRTQQAQTKVEP